MPPYYIHNKQLIFPVHDVKLEKYTFKKLIETKYRRSQDEDEDKIPEELFMKYTRDSR